MTPRFIAVPLFAFLALLLFGVSWEVAFLLTGPLILISISHYLTHKALEEHISRELSASASKCPPHQWHSVDNQMQCKNCMFSVSEE